MQRYQKTDLGLKNRFFEVLVLTLKGLEILKISGLKPEKFWSSMLHFETSLVIVLKIAFISKVIVLNHFRPKSFATMSSVTKLVTMP